MDVTSSTRPTAVIEDLNLYRLLVDSVRDYAIFHLDPDGYVASWNEGAQRIKGYHASEIIGRHFSTFYTQDDISAGKPPMELEVAGIEGRFEDEGWRLRRDGTRIWANVVITALRSPEGVLVGYAKVTRDLSERRRAEHRALEAARRVAEAEGANRAKVEFLAAMSHELRTPLNAIGGYAELLQVGIGGPVTPQQLDYLARIQHSQQHLLGIITDLLNYSRIEAGQLTYDVSAVPVHALLDTVLSMMEPMAVGKRQVVERVPCTDDPIASADGRKAEQIVLNLLSNAVKFTPAGGRITVSCAESPRTVTITVRDTGPGIAPDQQRAIFEPFVQLGRSLSSTQEGAGLGLAISRDLAAAMGGTLQVESVVGMGSAFTLALPRSFLSPSSAAA